MKNNILLILFIIPVHFLCAQNVKIIRASERTTVSSTVFIPAPANASAARTAPAAVKKVNPAAAQKSPAQNKAAVKSVRGGCEKKCCVKKVITAKKNPPLPLKSKPVESAKK